jgi:hypothetical protein
MKWSTVFPALHPYIGVSLVVGRNLGRQQDGMIDQYHQRENEDEKLTYAMAIIP